jgi:hypothetical protein
MPLSEKFLLHFNPESWTPERRFASFLGAPFAVDKPLSRGVGAVMSHLEKYELLGELANNVVPLLEKDNIQFAEAGYSHETGGRIHGALMEALLGELYSVLDGIRQVLYSVYRKTTPGIQNKSTNALFERAARGQYGSEFPEELRTILADAYHTWFPRLRSLRSENTHGKIGACYLPKDSPHIRYMHNGLEEEGHALIIDDITGYVNELHSYIRELVNRVFSYLFERLEPVERQTFCGTYKGRMYERMVAPSRSLSLADGRCLSINWFSNEPELACPLRDRCGAYGRPVSAEEHRLIFSTR